MEGFGSKLWDKIQSQGLAMAGSLADETGHDLRAPGCSEKATSPRQGDNSDSIRKDTSASGIDSTTDFLGSFFTTRDTPKGTNTKLEEPGVSHPNKKDTSRLNEPPKMKKSKSAFGFLEDTTSSYTDKFIERFISMAIPTTTTSSKRELDRILNRIEMQKTRPPLSVQTMSRNSILLLQRLSLPFEALDLIINILNWETPIVTITTMLFLTLCLLKPINFLTLPIFYVCFEIIIPAYMVQNPNTDESMDGWETELPKPVNQFSREFLLNVTDLQNHMLLYVNAWDFINAWCWKLFYFKDELLSWFIFVVLLFWGVFVQIFGASIITFCFPVIKVLAVVMSWGVIIALHPKNRVKLLETFYSEELRLKIVSLLNHYESNIISDLDLTTDKMEIREIEIFELQVFNEETRTWQFVCFSPDNYPPNSHIRQNKIPINGTLLLDSVLPPKGWKFINLSENDNKIPVLSKHKTEVLSQKEENTRGMYLDHDKRKQAKEKKRMLRRQRRQQRRHGKTDTNQVLLKVPVEPKQSSIQHRRVSNDFHNVMIDPRLVDNYLIEQLETGIKYEGWYIDLCPKTWVQDYYLQDVFEVDDDTKWVYDLVVMGNGIDALSAGLGIPKTKLRKSRGDVRRRRWVRYAVRDIVRGVQTDFTEQNSDDKHGDNASIFSDEEEDSENGYSFSDDIDYTDIEDNSGVGEENVTAALPDTSLVSTVAESPETEKIVNPGAEKLKK